MKHDLYSQIPSHKNRKHDTVDLHQKEEQVFCGVFGTVALAILWLCDLYVHY